MSESQKAYPQSIIIASFFPLSSLILRNLFFLLVPAQSPRRRMNIGFVLRFIRKVPCKHPSNHGLRLGSDSDIVPFSVFIVRILDQFLDHLAFVGRIRFLVKIFFHIAE